jgi:hypothetical protein
MLLSIQSDPRTPPAALALLDRLWRRDFYQEVARIDRSAPHTALEALRTALEGLDAIVTERWLGAGSGEVRFEPPCATPIATAPRTVRVTVLTRKRVHRAEARRVTMQWIESEL